MQSQFTKTTRVAANGCNEIIGAETTNSQMPLTCTFSVECHHLLNYKDTSTSYLVFLVEVSINIVQAANHFPTTNVNPVVHWQKAITFIQATW